MSTADEKSLADYLAFAHHLADLSAAEILPHFRNLSSVVNKSGGAGFDPVTSADRNAEQVIRDEIVARWPDHAVRGEEFGATSPGREYCWLIDPIDGTRPFIMGMPVWGTLIGLVKNDAPILGLMNQPFTRERFWSGESGAFYRGADGEREIKTRSCPRLGDAMLSSTSPDLFATRDHKERFDALSGQVRMRWFGGDCYAYCLLAAGHIDLVVESGLKAHDIAALIPIIERAGGCVTGWSGGSAAEGGDVAACGDPALRDQVLEILAA